MANKAMWDWMDKHEGRKDSSFDNANKERKRQGVKPMSDKKNSVAKKMQPRIVGHGKAPSGEYKEDSRGHLYKSRKHIPVTKLHYDWGDK